MRAWDRLHADRSHTVTGTAAPMGAIIIKSKPGRLPWSVIDRWCQRKGLGPDETQFLEACLAVLDSVYLAWWDERNG